MAYIQFSFRNFGIALKIPYCSGLPPFSLLYKFQREIMIPVSAWSPKLPSLNPFISSNPLGYIIPFTNCFQNFYLSASNPICPTSSLPNKVVFFRDESVLIMGLLSRKSYSPLERCLVSLGVSMWRLILKQLMISLSRISSKTCFYSSNFPLNLFIWLWIVCVLLICLSLLMVNLSFFPLF